MGIFGFIFKMYKNKTQKNVSTKKDNTNLFVDNSKKEEYDFLKKIYITDMNEKTQYDFLKKVERGFYRWPS